MTDHMRDHMRDVRDIRDVRDVRDMRDMRDVRDVRDVRDIQMNDIRGDDYSLEEKIVTSVWVHDRGLTGKSIDELRMDFEQRFNKKAPKHDSMIGWERSAFTTGSVLEHVPNIAAQTREQQQHHNRMHMESGSMSSSMSRSSTGRGGRAGSGGGGGGDSASKQQQQQHEQQQSASSYHPSLYKTELCRQYYEYGYCDYGERCLFAHGKYELKRIPNYKTKLCASYHSSGYCSFGSRCAFIHKKHEAREGSEGPTKVRSSRSIRPNRRTELSRKK